MNFQYQEPTLRSITINGMTAGAAIAMAAFSSAVCSATIANPSASMFAKATVFPFGLIMIVLAGMALFTGNIFNIVKWSKQDTKHKVALLTWNWVANLVGASLISGILFLTTKNTFGTTFLEMASNKIALSPPVIMLSGIMCNILVCFATAMGQRKEDTFFKTITAFIPIFFFVIGGFEHCVANMFYFSYAFCLDPRLSLLKIGSALLFATIGNIFGGLLVVKWAKFKWGEA